MAGESAESFKHFVEKGPKAFVTVPSKDSLFPYSWVPVPYGHGGTPLN